MKFSFAAIAFVVVLPVSSVFADSDWPQWRGPNRDGHAAAQSLLQEWPENGPQLKWEASELGEGYSTVSIVGGLIYTMGAIEGQCRVHCLDAQDGSIEWSTVVSRAGTSDDYNDQWGAGPRSTPTVDGDQVFVLSDIGQLAALNRKTGQIQWTTNLVTDHAGEIPNWGYAESPLIDGDRVVVTPGGKKFMIALDRTTGKVTWYSRDVDTGAQYVSVIKGTVGSKSYYVTAGKPGLYAFDTQTGSNLFSDENTGNRIAVIPTPILAGDFLYHTSAYGAGNTLLKLSQTDNGIDVESIYHLAEKSMENHHGGVVLDDEIIYGFTKANGGQWMAQSLLTGETLWQHRSRPNKSGSICMADGRLYCYNDKDGSVLLIEPKKNDYAIHGSLTLPRQTEIPRNKGAIWAHPVVADHTLFIRDHDLMFAYDIGR